MSKKIIFFFNGTWSTHNATPTNHLIARLYHSIMYNPHNSIVQMYQNCNEPYKYIFDGPGTDIFSNEKSASRIDNYIYSIVGGIDGSIGNNSVTHNLQNALNIIKSHKGSLLEIYTIGWSRGAFTAWLLKKNLRHLIRENHANITKLSMTNIDTAPGTFFDRIRMSLTSLEDPKDIILNSTSYYSDTGNIDLWDSLFPIKINMPICAPLDDDTENAEKFLLRGNHEDLAGHSRGLNDPKHIKRIVGDIVIANIIYRSSLMGIHFDIEWKNDIVLRGTHAMKTYCASGVKPLRTRNFLSTDQKINCFFCKSSSEILKLNVFNSDNFF